MFGDVGALLSFLGQSDPAQADALAAHLDSQGVPPPAGLMGMMKLGVGGTPDGSPAIARPGAMVPPLPGIPSALPNSGGDPNNNGMGLDLGSMMPTGGAVGGMAGGTVADPANPPPASPPNPYAQAIGQAGMKLAQPTPMPGPIPGVTGGVKAPEHHPMNPAVLQNLLALVMQKHAGGGGSNLGSLIR